MTETPKRIFLPIGWFWPLLAGTLALAALGSVALLAYDPLAAAGFGISAAWVVLFIGALGVILGGLCQLPMTPRLKAAVLLAVLLKIVLFIGGAVAVLAVVARDPEPRLAISVLVGIHLLPLAAVARWIFGASRAIARPENKPAVPSSTPHSAS